MYTVSNYRWWTYVYPSSTLECQIYVLPPNRAYGLKFSDFHYLSINVLNLKKIIKQKITF